MRTVIAPLIKYKKHITKPNTDTYLIKDVLNQLCKRMNIAEDIYALLTFAYQSAIITEKELLDTLRLNGLNSMGNPIED